MGRAPCCEREFVKKGPWTPEEDAKLLACIAKYGTGNWRCLPQKAGLQRCGKSCRLRWTNYLRPDLRHDQFSDQEEHLIIKLHAALGSRWSLIAAQLPGRTDNDVKNYWNTRLKKRLCEMGIDPITHKPISQLLVDLATTMKLPKGSEIAEATLGCLKDDMLNVIMRKGSENITSQNNNVDVNTGGSASDYRVEKPIVKHTKTMEVKDWSESRPLIASDFASLEHQSLMERQQEEQDMNSLNSTVPCNDHKMKRKASNSTYINGRPCGPVNGIRSTYATMRALKIEASNHDSNVNPVVAQMNTMKKNNVVPPYIMDTRSYTLDMLLPSKSTSSSENNLGEMIHFNHGQMKEGPDLNVIENVHHVNNHNNQYTLSCTTLLQQQEESLTTYSMEFPFPLSMSYPVSPNQWTLEGENPRFHEPNPTIHDHSHGLLAPEHHESDNNVANSNDSHSRHGKSGNDQEFFHQQNHFLTSDGFFWDFSELMSTNIP